jgi:hypothetical protein
VGEPPTGGVLGRGAKVGRGGASQARSRGRHGPRGHVAKTRPRGWLREGRGRRGVSLFISFLSIYFPAKFKLERDS